MNNIMKKTVCAIILISAAVLACSRNVFDFSSSAPKQKIEFDKDGYWKTQNFRVKLSNDGTISYYSSTSLYGAILAANMANMRNDYREAAEYYKIALEKAPDNASINYYVYQLLAVDGNIAEAAEYAKKDLNPQKPKLLPIIIVSSKYFKDGQYEKVRKTLAPLSAQKAYRNSFVSLIEAWSFAGEKQEKAAIQSLDKIKDASLIAIKLAHKGLIYEYLGNNAKADESYTKLVNDYPKEMTYRLLDVITNFYARTGQKEKAMQIYNRYTNDGALSALTAGLQQKISDTNEKTVAIIDTPQKGLAEVLYNVSTGCRAAGDNNSARFYLTASAFLNPEYEITDLALANLYEESGLYNEAIRYYSKINEGSGTYYIAQLKTIENLNELKEYDKAKALLHHLLKIYPNNSQLLNDLADIERKTGNNDKAIKLYHQAIEAQKTPNSSDWPIYYALGVSYFQNKQFSESYDYLYKALELSNRNPIVLNYLGFVYLEKGINTDEAVQMILDAYSTYSYDGHIIDSLGWAFFRLGQYNKAISYLEQAADINPANAVICDHLGDAYWFVGRKNEARYQWQHALVLKEDADEIDKDAIQKKIDSNKAENTVLFLQNPKVIKELADLAAD